MTQDISGLDFCPSLKKLLSTGHVRLSSGEHIAVAGTSTLNNIKALRCVLQKEKPSNTLEIGLAYGASALTFLSTNAELKRPNLQHVAIDPYQSSKWRSAGLDVIREANLASSFKLIEQDSAIALPSLCSEGASFGVIYIDGSHIFENVFIDMFYCTRLLDVGGLLLFDDSMDRHVKKVLRFVETNFKDILKLEDVVANKSWKQSIGQTFGFRQLTAYRKLADLSRAWSTKFIDF